MPFCPAFTIAAKILPRPESGYAGGGRHLPRNLQHVPKAVLVKAAHGGEVVGEGFGVSGLQLLNQELDVGGDDFLFGVGLLADGGDVVCVGCGVHGVISLALLLHVRVETRHVHAERHLAKAGVANGKVFERSFLGGPRVAWGSQNPKGEWPCRARGAEPTRKVWFPYSCASAHRISRVGVAGGKSRRGGSGERASGRSAEETSSAKHLHSLLNYLANGEAIRNVLLLHGLRFHLFAKVLLWCHALLDAYLRRMGALV